VGENLMNNNIVGRIGSIAIVITSCISLIYLLTSIKSPTTFVHTVPVNENGVEPDPIRNATKDKKGVFIITYTTFDNEKNVTEKSQLFTIQKTDNPANIFSKAINNLSVKEIYAQTIENEIRVTHKSGGNIRINIANTKKEKSRNIDFTRSLENESLKGLSSYVQTIVNITILFFMIFYIFRSIMPGVNSTSKLEDITKSLVKKIDERLLDVQEMDKDIHTEALIRMDKTDDEVLKDFEGGDYRKITVVSRSLTSDTAKDNSIIKQVVRNLYKGVKYRWITSNAIGRTPLDQLMLHIKSAGDELLQEQTLKISKLKEKIAEKEEEIKEYKEKNDNESANNISNLQKEIIGLEGKVQVLDSENIIGPIEHHYDCINFYSVNYENFLPLPYELNFYFSKTEHRLIGFDRNHNIELSECVDVDKLKSMIDGWMHRAECTIEKYLYIDKCGKGVSSCTKSELAEKEVIGVRHCLDMDNYKEPVTKELLDK
jgi:hypothetical protein